MRTTLIVLATLCLLPTTAADPATYTLFEDATGDAGPIAAWGVPVPGLANDHADLVGATLEVGADGALLRLRLASVPAELPPDIIYFAGWEREDAAFVGAGYFRLVTPEKPEGEEMAFACVYVDAPPQEGGEGECEEVAATRAPDGFDLPLALELLADGEVGAPMGAVVRVLDATAWPLFALHFTGLTVMDLADGEDLTIAMPTAEDQDEAVVTTQAAESRSEVPGAGLAWGLSAIGLLALATRRR